MVKMRILILLAVLIVGGDSLGLAQEQAAPMATPPPGLAQGLVSGRLHWVHNSVCEYRGQFLTYYIQGCTMEQRVWLYHPDLPPTDEWSGRPIWAAGILTNVGFCLVLDMRGRSLTLCPSATDCQASR